MTLKQLEYFLAIAETERIIQGGGLIPHKRENYGHIIRQYQKIAGAMRGPKAPEEN